MAVVKICLSMLPIFAMGQEHLGTFRGSSHNWRPAGTEQLTDTELTAASASGGMRFDLIQSQMAWTWTCGSKAHLW